MSASEYDVTDDLADEIPAYRALCKSAVASLLLALLSLSALLGPLLLVVPALGLTFGLFALSKLRRFPDELTGKPAAWIGIVVCSLMFVGAATLHAVLYATEVPEGYERIAFDDLQPTAEAPSQSVSPRALALSGKKIFMKGYVFPGDQRFNIKRFILVADLGTCCFGTQPKLTHMVEVTLRDPYRVAYSYRKLKLGGTLKVDTRLKPVSGVGGVYFQLDADYVR
jgi:hypothetical protein